MSALAGFLVAAFVMIAALVDCYGLICLAYSYTPEGGLTWTAAIPAGAALVAWLAIMIPRRIRNRAGHPRFGWYLGAALGATAELAWALATHLAQQPSRPARPIDAGLGLGRM
ncbi:MAG: hypothetical protein BIFFINMI_02846 [Phycisphaerae bacterium]|nr:hypothetical protein [Phycisphaerae bacterium]